MNKTWKQLIIKTKYENKSFIEGIIYANEIYSFEIIDPRMDKIDNKEGRWDFIEENIFKGQYDGVTFKLYSSTNEDIEKLDNIKAIIEREGLGLIESSQIDDEDWKNNWKSFYETQEIGNKLVIKPTWESYDNIDSRHVIELDPGMAFGTGGHETTRMCLEAIEKYLNKGDILFDIGCGSGILSIGAKLLGASKVYGADLDESAVEISKENAKLNSVDVDFFISDLFSSFTGKANIVVANIVAEIVVVLVDELKNYLENNGTFICSGIIEEKSHLVENKLIEESFEIIEKKKDKEWICLVARRKNA